jgi:general secretion pathway protein G
MRRIHYSAAACLFPLCACSRLHVPEDSKVDSDIMSLESAVVAFAVQNGGVFPESLEVLAVPDETGFQFLAKEVPLDPWGHPYGYEPPAQRDGLPRVFSHGSDGKPGGEGDARDHDNLMLRKDGR